MSLGKPISKLEVNYLPHAGQIEIANALIANFRSATPATVVEVIASRGWGKTLWLCCHVLIPYLEQHPNAKVMWVAPTYQIAMSPIEDVFKGVDERTGKRWVPQYDDTGAKVWDFKTGVAGMTLTWHNGATVTFKSADSEDSIVSRGYNFIIIDEAALILERTFTQQILGTARKAGIKIFMITSPRGKKHWTYKYFLQGQDPAETDYLSFQHAWHKNPHFNMKQLAIVKRNLPEHLFRQEYLAEFIEEGDSVFRNLDLVIEGTEIAFESPQQEWISPVTDKVINVGTPLQRTKSFAERRFVLAVDFAKSVDYTVMYVMDLDDGSCAYYKRMNKTDYRIVIREAANVCKSYNNCDMIFDATGVGQGLADFIANEDVIAHPFTFTNDSKSEIINALALSIEYQEITIPNIVTVKNELSVFSFDITRTGKITYNAPSGHHDDVVCSLAMANWFRKENGGVNEALILEDIIKVNGGGHGRRTFHDEMDEDND